MEPREMIAAGIEGTLNAVANVGWQMHDRRKLEAAQSAVGLPKVTSQPAYNPNWLLQLVAKHSEGGLLAYVLMQTSSAHVANVAVAPDPMSENVALLGDTEWPGEVAPGTPLMFIVQSSLAYSLARPAVIVTWDDFDGDACEQRFEISVTGSSVLDQIF